MSEVQNHAPKHEKLPHLEASSEAAKAHLDALKQRAEAESEHRNDEEVLESIKKDVEQAAVSKEDYKHTEAGNGGENTPTQTYVSRELKQMGFRRTLTNARMRMNAPQRLVSKAIHQPVVEKVSEVAGPTIARPSGLIGGGLAALLGNGVLLYITKHYGYRYNYYVFIALFIGGFAAGMLIELLVRMMARRRA